MVAFDVFSNQLLIEGIIKLETGLHIGGGETDAYGADAAVVKTIEGSPYIPGSSIKGVLRTFLERLGQSGLLEAENYPKPCMVGEQTLCLSDLRTKEKRNIKRQSLGENGFQEYIEKNSCAICQLFGNNLRAAKVKISDAFAGENWTGHYDIRQGVGIDRDKGTASDRMKYDFEVVPAGTEFQFKIKADNLTPLEKKWLFVGLEALRTGQLQLGGKTARGIGHVSGLNWKVEEVTKDQFIDYLLTKQLEKKPFEACLAEIV